MREKRNSTELIHEGKYAAEVPSETNRSMFPVPTRRAFHAAT